VVSNHAHFYARPSSAQQLARFMQFLNANIAKEAARLHNWPSASGPAAIAPSPSSTTRLPTLACATN